MGHEGASQGAPERVIPQAISGRITNGDGVDDDGHDQTGFP